MIGYTPVLGQIGLSRLGQYETEASKEYQARAQMAIDRWVADQARIEKLASVSERKAIKAWIIEGEEGVKSSLKDTADLVSVQLHFHGDFNDPRLDLEVLNLESFLGVLEEKIKKAEMATAMSYPSETIPTWGYIVGGLAIAGMLAYVARR